MTLISMAVVGIAGGITGSLGLSHYWAKDDMDFPIGETFGLVVGGLGGLALGLISGAILGELIF